MGLSRQELGYSGFNELGTVQMIQICLTTTVIQYSMFWYFAI